MEGIVEAGILYSSCSGIELKNHPLKISMLILITMPITGDLKKHNEIMLNKSQGIMFSG